MYNAYIALLNNRLGKKKNQTCFYAQDNWNLESFKLPPLFVM